MADPRDAFPTAHDPPNDGPPARGSRHHAPPARQVPLIPREALRSLDPDGIGGLLEGWHESTLVLDPTWEGEFATEALETEASELVGMALLLTLVVSPRDRAPVDGKIYLVRPPDGEAAVATFRETDYVAMFELASRTVEHHAFPANQCSVIGRVTCLIARL